MRIKNKVAYPDDVNVSIKDSLIGSDFDNGGRTKNYPMASIATFILEQVGYLVGNTVIQGTVVWLQDLDFEVTELLYTIGGTYYTSEGGVVTLEDADDTLDRIDVIYADTDGNVGVVTGVPSENPLRPTLEENQLLLSFVLVEAGATEPSGATKQTIYDENVGEPTEWLATTSTQSGEYVFDSTTNPNTGLVHMTYISQGNSVNDFIEIKTPQDNLYVDSSSALNFFVKLDYVVNGHSYFIVRLEGDTGAISDDIIITDGLYGLDLSNTSTYQNIIIPFDSINLSGSSLRAVVVDCKFPAVGEGCHLDTFSITNSNINTNTYSTFLSLLDTPSNYTNQAGKKVVVKQDELGLEFADDVDLSGYVPYNGATQNLNLGSQAAFTQSYFRALLEPFKASLEPDKVNITDAISQNNMTYGLNYIKFLGSSGTPSIYTKLLFESGTKPIDLKLPEDSGRLALESQLTPNDIVFYSANSSIDLSNVNEGSIGVLKNVSEGTITLTFTGGVTLEGQTSVDLDAGNSITITKYLDGDYRVI